MGKQRSYELLYEDPNYIVVNKAPNVLVLQDRYDHDIKNLKAMLSDRFGDIYIVHRIDKGTSGIVVFARNSEAHKHLSLQFENRLVEKYYLAIANGVFNNPTGTIEKLIAIDEARKGLMKAVRNKGKSAISHFEVEEQFIGYALVKVQIETGRTHQVRVHLSSIGHPLVGDSKYGGQESLSINDIKKRISGSSERPLIHRPALHAHSIKFKSITGDLMSFECNPPKDIRATLNQLRKWKKI